MKRPQRRSKQKQKAEIMPIDQLSSKRRRALAAQAKYFGSPFHKRHPDDYGMPELPKPREDKTQCDADRRIRYGEAVRLMKKGFRRGLISVQWRGQWPQNVWAVDANGVVYEAQLQNAEQGEYHGYPMKANDDFTEVVRTEWERRKP